MYRDGAIDNNDVLLDAFDSAGIAIAVLDRENQILQANVAWFGDSAEPHVPALLRIEASADCTIPLYTAARNGDECAARLLSALERVQASQISQARSEYYQAAPECWFELTVSARRRSPGV